MGATPPPSFYVLERGPFLKEKKKGIYQISITVLTRQKVTLTSDENGIYRRKLSKIHQHITMITNILQGVASCAAAGLSPRPRPQAVEERQG